MGGETCRVLLVDDDEDDYILTDDLLKQASHYRYHLDWISNYEVAAQKLSFDNYDAALVDYDFADQHTGIDLIRELTAQGSPVPFILFTGRGNYETDLAAMQAGATMYLTKKEATPLLLDRIIRYAIERKKTETQLQQETHQRQQVEDQLRREREVLRAIVLEQKKDRQLIADLLESIRDGFFAVDRDWRFTYANSVSTQGLNITPQELIGQNLWDMYPQLIGTPLEAAYRQVMDNQHPQHLEIPGVLTGKWYDVRVYPSAGGISVFWVDKSDQKRAEQALLDSEAHHRLILDSVYNGYALCEVIFDPQETPVDFRIIDTNASLERLLGLTREEITGKTILEIRPEFEPVFLQTFAQVAVTGEPARFTYLVDNLNKTFDVSVIRPRPNHIAVLFVDLPAIQQTPAA